MKPRTGSELRQTFIEYFVELGHEHVPSAPLPILGNPTLHFTNAGMNQFVDAFMGKEKPPARRATTVQKCMRVQGKHNDLENVGPSPRHHTFFEMLGNFSFGDYFKKRAIKYAHHFMTEVCEIDPDKLWFTVNEQDDEAYGIWLNEIGVPVERVLRMGDKTNFWTMGDIGPCGPTSEIHYDWGADHCSCDLDDCSVLLDNDCERWLEVWNLVFMQFQQLEDGRRLPLPNPGVDTGMGLERLASVIQDTPVNYDNDLFQPGMRAIDSLVGRASTGTDIETTARRVIADHARAAVFLLADGVVPGNVGRGYVLRMVIRRAARFGRKIGLEDPFLYEVGRAFIDVMAAVYPELQSHREHIRRSITGEEERFSRTVEGALSLLEETVRELQGGGSNEIDGATAFDLYATHGLPLELTQDYARENGLTVDEAGFRVAREAHAAASGAGAFGTYQGFSNDLFVEVARLFNESTDGAGSSGYDPYGPPELAVVVKAILRDGELVQSASAGDEIGLVFDKTPCYVEAGGEVSDTAILFNNGSLSLGTIVDVANPIPGVILHRMTLERGGVDVGHAVRVQVDDRRRSDIRRNHTATHLLHRALRLIVGEHVTQQGSLVAPDRLRFDFSHSQALSKKQLELIETEVNKNVLLDLPVVIKTMSLVEAREAGAMALFGEKYGDEVRTIRIGGENEDTYSFELCGGLHVAHTGDIGLFKITGQEAVGAGLRRIEAVSGRGSREYISSRLSLLDTLVDTIGVPETESLDRLVTQLAEAKVANRQLAKVSQELARQKLESVLLEPQNIEGVSTFVALIDGLDAGGLRLLADYFRERIDSGVAVLATVVDGRPLVLAVATRDVVGQGVHAGYVVKSIAGELGGGGGGRADLAQAGGNDASRLESALSRVPELIRSMVSAAG